MRKHGVAGRHCCDGGEGGTPQLDPALKWMPNRGGNGKERVDSGKYQQVVFTGIRGTCAPFSSNQMHVPLLSTHCGAVICLLALVDQWVQLNGVPVCYSGFCGV